MSAPTSTDNSVPIKKVFPFLAIATFSSLIGATIIIPVVPIFIERLDLTGIWVGALFAVYSGTRVLLAPLIGRLSDKFGRKPFIILGLAINIVTSLTYIWADAGWQLLLVRILHGTGAAMVYPIALGYIGDLTPVGSEGKWMGYFNATVFTAFGIGPLLSGLLIDNFGFSVPFYVMTGMCLFALIITTMRLPETHGKMTTQQQTVSLLSLLRNNTMQGIFTYRLASEAAFGIWLAFIAVFAGQSLNLGPSLIGILLTVSVFISAILMFFTGRIVDKLNKKRVLIISGLGAAIFLALTPLAPAFWFLLALSVFAGLLGAFEFPTSSALAIAEGRKHGMGSTMALMTMAASGGTVIGPLIGGAVMQVSDVNSAFYAAGGLSVIGVIFLALLLKR
jgi:DHA1 family multidrug resistance protein-like MFS transporter